MVTHEKQSLLLHSHVPAHVADPWPLFSPPALAVLLSSRGRRTPSTVPAHPAQEISHAMTVCPICGRGALLIPHLCQNPRCLSLEGSSQGRANSSAASSAGSSGSDRVEAEHDAHPHRALAPTLSSPPSCARTPPIRARCASAFCLGFVPDGPVASW